MARDDARAVACQVADEVRDWPPQRLLASVEEDEERTVAGPGGVAYQVRIQGWSYRADPGRMFVDITTEDGSLRAALRPEAAHVEFRLG
ncbi:MAG TPA: hypothetical protein VGD67_10265 [Pseudonocardiaceae bacterium]